MEFVATSSISFCICNMFAAHSDRRTYLPSASRGALGKKIPLSKSIALPYSSSAGVTFVTSFLSVISMRCTKGSASDHFLMILLSNIMSRRYSCMRLLAFSTIAFSSLECDNVSLWFVPMSIINSSIMSFTKCDPLSFTICDGHPEYPMKCNRLLAELIPFAFDTGNYVVFSGCAFYLEIIFLDLYLPTEHSTVFCGVDKYQISTVRP